MEFNKWSFLEVSWIIKVLINLYTRVSERDVNSRLRYDPCFLPREEMKTGLASSCRLPWENLCSPIPKTLSNPNVTFVSKTLCCQLLRKFRPYHYQYITLCIDFGGRVSFTLPLAGSSTYTFFANVYLKKILFWNFRPLFFFNFIITFRKKKNFKSMKQCIRSTYWFRRINTVALSGLKKPIVLILANPFLVVLILLLPGVINLKKNGKIKINWSKGKNVPRPVSNAPMASRAPGSNPGLGRFCLIVRTGTTKYNTFMYVYFTCEIYSSNIEAVTLFQLKIESQFKNTYLEKCPMA